MNPEPHKESKKGDKVVVMPFRQSHSSYHSKYEVYVKKDGKPVEVKDKSEKFVYY